MTLFKHILLASHGTKGALAAENMALQVCAANGTITHLIVVPEFWQNMTGDDWLNNAIIRDQFCNYLQTELGQEIDRQCDRLHRKVISRKLTYKRIILHGKPDRALIQHVNKHAYDLLVTGSRRTINIPGIQALRSTMLSRKLLQSISTALLIVPYPK